VGGVGDLERRPTGIEDGDSAAGRRYGRHVDHAEHISEDANTRVEVLDGQDYSQLVDRNVGHRRPLSRRVKVS
jgi:hypothetical protein